MRLKTVTVIDILRQTHESEIYFLKTDTMEIVKPFDYLKKFLPANPTDEDYKKLPSKRSLNIYALPSYEFINHKEIMTWYVKEMIEDKEVRKELFSVLRNYNYMDKFYEVLNKYNLFDDYDQFSYDYYLSVYDQWCKKEDIKF